MPSFSTKRRVPFSAIQMYALVADIERYPEFLPMCTGLTVQSRVDVAGGQDLVARMSVGYKQIAEAFTTSVRLRPQALSVEANYLDGPFKRLENNWRFIDAPGGSSDTDFHISYEFKSPILGLLVGGVFDQAFRKFAEAFEMRARKIYGEPPVPSS
jgi:coenzyme Q-binding protein COQ10